MKKLILITILSIVCTFANSQNPIVKKLYVRDTVFLTKGIWFGVDSSYMDVAGGTASDTTYWNYPTYDGHKMINARQSKQVNADSGFASSGYIWLKAPTNKNKGSYYIGSGTPGIGATSSGNNIFGYNAGALTYSGGYNNIIGYQAGAMLYDGYQNTFIGANSGYTSSSAYKNVFIGHNSGYFNTTGAFNTFLGWQSGYSTTSGLRNLYLGYMAGNYMTTESNRIILNTIDRTTKAKDTVFSPIYIYETSDTATSNIWLNGNVNVRGNFTVHGSALSGVAGDTATIYASKTFVAGKYATLRDLTWSLVAPGSGYIQPKNSKSIMADSLFYNDSTRIAMFSDINANLILGRYAGLANYGTDNVFIGSYSGNINTSGIENVFIGNSSGIGNTVGEANAFIGYGSGYEHSTGNYNIMLGYYAGSKLINCDNKLIISSINQVNQQDDTINSIIFGHQDLVSLNQRLYLNSNVYVKHNFFVGGIDANPKWGLVAPGSGYLNVLNSKKIIATSFYTTDSIDVYNVTDTRYFIGAGGKRTATGVHNIVIGDVTAGDNLGTAAYNVLLGYNTGSAISSAAMSHNVFIGTNAGSAAINGNNIYIGAYSGKYMTSEGHRVKLGTYDCTNKAGDTTRAFYFYETPTRAGTIFYLNGKTKISEDLVIGDVTNNISLDTAGAITLNGSATVWDDLFFPFTSATRGALTCPTFNADSIWYEFSSGTDTTTCKMFVTAQMPHSWKQGSRIYPHIHYKYTTGQGTPTFRIRYKWVNINGSTDVAWKYFTLSTTTGTTNNTHQYVDSPTGIDGTGKTISSILRCEIYLVTSSGATKTCDAYQFDLHIEKDGIGSKREDTK